jgi:hypothetical protein
LWDIVFSNMKTLRPLLTALLALSAAGGLVAKGADHPNPRVEVNYHEPERFTDARDSYMGSNTDAGYLSELKDYLAWRARYSIAADQKLTITFTDVDLAGDFEPWRGMRWSDIRVVKPLYPSRLKFSFTLTDATGAVIKSGERELADLNLVRLPSLMPDPLRFEKGLLDDWMRAEFPRQHS